MKQAYSVKNDWEAVIMSDYMRKVFYVRKREENPDCSVTAGYVKAERRKQVLTLTIFLDTQDLPEECPVCAVYCTGREWQCFSCGWVTFDKNGTTVCNLFLPDDETIAHADAVAGIGIGQKWRLLGRTIAVLL